MRRLISSLVVAVFCATSSPAFAQVGAIKEGAQKAGKATTDAAKQGAKATAKGTKKVAGETKDAVQTTYTCADGTTDAATLKDNACRSHGGVKHKAKH